MKHQYGPLALLSSMFLLVGSLFCMNDILLPSLVTWFRLNYTQATMIQFSFYLTYIVFPLPIAWMIHRYGYKISLLLATLSCAVGCLLFVPAKWFDSYLIVLLAIFVISTGLTIINVAANPFAALLGDPRGAHQRINFVQVFSRVGYAATPLLATALIYRKTGEVLFHLPYLVLAVALILISALIFFSRLPSMKPGADEKFVLKGLLREAFRYPHLVFGVLAMFFYMGAEACTAGFFIPYLKTVLQYSDQRAAGMMTVYYVCTAAMGLLGVFLLKYVPANRLVGIFGLGMIALYLFCITAHSSWNGWALAGLGLFLSIMFPTLFSLGIEEIGAFTNKGSALLNFAIVGGSVFSPLQGTLADHFGVQHSYVVPLFCFVMITIYAFFFTREPLARRKAKQAGTQK